MNIEELECTTCGAVGEYNYISTTEIECSCGERKDITDAPQMSSKFGTQ